MTNRFTNTTVSKHIYALNQVRIITCVIRIHCWPAHHVDHSTLAVFFEKHASSKYFFKHKIKNCKHSAVQLDTTRTPFFIRANKGLRTFGKRHGLLLILNLCVFNIPFTDLIRSSLTWKIFISLRIRWYPYPFALHICWDSPLTKPHAVGSRMKNWFTFFYTQGRAYGRTHRAGEFKCEFPPSPPKHCRYAT